MQHNIRCATPPDAQPLTDISFRSKAHWGYSREFMEACRAELCVTPEHLNRATFSYWVVEQGNNIAGFYAIQQLTEHEAELDALFVLPEHMGKGIGGALMQHALSYARQRGFSTLNVQSDPHAEAFYLAAGATLIGKQESGSIAGRQLPLLTFDLTPQ